MIRSPFHFFAKRRHNKWLVLIAAYKLLQALLIGLIGLGARHLLHKDVGDELATLADHFRFNPESRLVNFILDRSEVLNDPVLRRIGFVAFSLSAISAIEGVGLYFEKVWAEYLTLAITASFLPWEIFEIFRRLTWKQKQTVSSGLRGMVHAGKKVFKQSRVPRPQCPTPGSAWD